MKTDLLQSCGHCWVFQICWHIECSTFTASSFRIWNSSTGIPSPPLTLFIVMLSKAHLTSHSRMSGSRWVITSSWLYGSWRSFLYGSSVYSCHLFLISYVFVRSIPFLSFIEPIFAWNVPLVSLIFLKRSLVFPILLFSSISLHWSTEEGFLISFCYSLESLDHKVREFQKTIYLCFIDYASPLTVWIIINCGKLLKRWEYQTILPVPWETCMWVKKQQLEPCRKQLIGSRLRKEYNRAVCHHPVCLTCMLSTSWEMLDWISYKLESRKVGEKSTTSDMQMIPL